MMNGDMAEHEQMMKDDPTEEDELDQRASQEQQAALAQAVKPTEPLEPEVLTPLAIATVDAAEALSGGQVSAGPVKIEGPQETFPPELYAQVAAVAAVFDQAKAGEPYRFDPAGLVTNDAVAEAASKIGQASQDKALRREVATLLGSGEKPPAEKKPAAEKAPKDDNLDKYV